MGARHLTAATRAQPEGAEVITAYSAVAKASRMNNSRGKGVRCH